MATHRQLAASMYPCRSKADLLARLKKVEGQVRGLQKMVEEDRYCVDILTQVGAARAALGRIALSVVEDHTRGCVSEAVRSGQGEERVAELLQVIDQLLSKS